MKPMLLNSLQSMMDMTEEQVLNKISVSCSPYQYELLRRQWIYSAEKHKGQFRKNGDKYFDHIKRSIALTLNICDTINYLVLASILLYDLIEEGNATTYDIEINFGQDVAKLIQEVLEVYKKCKSNNSSEMILEDLYKHNKEALLVVLIAEYEEITFMVEINYKCVDKVMDHIQKILIPLANHVDILPISVGLSMLTIDLDVFVDETEIEEISKINLPKLTKKDVLQIFRNADEYYNSNKHQEAEDAYKKAIAAYCLIIDDSKQDEYAENVGGLIKTATAIASCYSDHKKMGKSEYWYRKALRIVHEFLSDDSATYYYYLAVAGCNLGRFLLRQRRLKEAEEELLYAKRMCDAVFHLSDANLDSLQGTLHYCLGVLYSFDDRYQEAENEMVQAKEFWLKLLDNNPVLAKDKLEMTFMALIDLATWQNRSTKLYETERDTLNNQ